ncbi:MAG: hypothetical protein V8T86_09730 [Victivallis sp.]
MPFTRFLLREEALAADAVPAGVFGLVDFAAVEKFLQNLPDHPLVEFFGRADVTVVRDAEPFPERLEAQHHFIAVRLRVEMTRRGGLFDLLAVLVGTGQKEGFVAERTVVAGEHVGQHGRVGVADVRLVVDVIDRSGDVKVFRVHILLNSLSENARQGADGLRRRFLRTMRLHIR